MEAAQDPDTGTRQQAITQSGTKTTIYVNGRSASVNLVDDAGTNGFLTVTQDLVTNTTALDFSYATPDATDPDLAILYQGAGAIPNSAFTLGTSSAHLALTTPAGYAINRCLVNLNTGDFTCAPSAALTFDLTWLRNGFGTVDEKTKRVETLGPVTTKVNAEFSTATATITGSFGGRTADSLSGELTDSHSKTYIREITVAP
ncbi:hypothetical protein BH11MYX3_BH11MYX3_10510 [soil metagenome]